MLPTLETGVLMVITSLSWGIYRSRNKKDGINRFGAIDTVFGLLTLIELISELSDFALIVIDSVDLHTAEDNRADAPADQESGEKPK